MFNGKYLSMLFMIPIFLFSAQYAYAYPDGLVLKEGMRSIQVTNLQQDLESLGFFGTTPTGYFGEITRNSVTEFQRNYNLGVDGIAGSQTFNMIDALLKRNSSTSRSGAVRDTRPQDNSIQLLPWFGKAEKIFSIGKTATVIDVDTGLKIQVKRTYGYNHADVETLTGRDTEILKKIAGGAWNWSRRAVIVEIDGYRIAGSMTPMPHAGRDDKPANIKVSGRSSGYGYGDNLDTVKGNDMDGHFDIHFYGSRTHSTNSVDAEHQSMIQKAYKSGM